MVSRRKESKMKKQMGTESNQKIEEANNENEDEEAELDE